MTGATRQNEETKKHARVLMRAHEMLGWLYERTDLTLELLLLRPPLAGSTLASSQTRPLSAGSPLAPSQPRPLLAGSTLAPSLPRPLSVARPWRRRSPGRCRHSRPWRRRYDLMLCVQDVVILLLKGCPQAC